jgi:Undecaprenyl-phosphate galactose phosphotransferase WbaP
MAQSNIDATDTENVEGATVDGATEPLRQRSDEAASNSETSQATGAPESNPRRNTLIKPRTSERLRSRVAAPSMQQHGSRQYIAQLFLTCTPLLIVDLFALTVSAFACHLAGLTWLHPEDPNSLASDWLPPVALSMVLINAVLGLYPGVRLGTVDEFKRLTLSLTIVGLILASRLRFGSEIWLDRMVFLFFCYLMILFLTPFVRSRVRNRLAKTSWWGFPTLVCGDTTTCFNVYQWLSDNKRLGLRPVGVVTDPDALELAGEMPCRVTSWEDGQSEASRTKAYWAVLVEEAEAVHDVTSIVENSIGNVPHVLVVSELTGIPDHWDRHQMDEGLPGFMIEQHLLLPLQRVTKRIIDLVIVAAVGLILAPLFLVLAIAIKLTSPGDIFYGHKRIGRGNSRFKAWKFRTMVTGADEMIQKYLAEHPEYRKEWEKDHKLRDDPRVTKLGKFMRKWSIDELPQIWNVFRGEMSIVGPRPIVDAEISKYGKHFETFCTVLPGLTGLWQVCGRNDTTYEERIQLDLYYIHHWSPWLDLYLLGKTIKTVLFTKGAY